MQGRRETLGPRHLDTPMTISNYAVLLKEQGNLTGAEPLYREALQGSRETLGPRHPQTLITLPWGRGKYSLRV